MYRLTEMLSPPVTQLQMTLASVQELLIQQQQKVQELAHELATAKVLVPDPLVSQVQVRRACSLLLSFVPSSLRPRTSLPSICLALSFLTLFTPQGSGLPL